MEPLKILYEDAHLVICCKPVGVLSEDSESGRCMPQLLREHYLAQGQKNPYIATVHRLDKITGGVMVFSRRREVTGKLTAAVQAHELVKEYLAVLRGHPQEPAATLTDLLFRDAGRNKSYVVQRPRKGVREASLEYRELSRTEELSLVRVRLHTGRTHQIRVQFSSRGLPLLGDIRYGSKDPNCTAALWSCRLAFRHPVTGRAVDVFCPPPRTTPGTCFRRWRADRKANQRNGGFLWPIRWVKWQNGWGCLPPRCGITIRRGCCPRWSAPPGDPGVSGVGL